MADEQKNMTKSGEGANVGETGLQPIQEGEVAEDTQLHPVRSQHSTVQEVSPGRSAAGGVETSGLGLPTSLHRAGTLPPQPRRNISISQDASNRPRGRTISARPQNFLGRELSPRSQMFKRSAIRPDSSEGGPDWDAVPQRQRSSAGRPRGSTVSEREPRFSFSSPGMRARTGTWASQSPRGIHRRPTVLMEAPQAITSGRDMDGQSANFTLAGPAPVETVAANQPYVDPGYTDLNPAYDQPQNTRPVWGLAKPLPRVIRPGMVPSRSELKIQIPAEEQRRQDANTDLEQGRVEPTLKLNRVTTQLQNAREDRENKLFQGMRRTSTGLSPAPVSPLMRRPTTNEAFSPGRQPIEEEEDLGAAKLKPSDLAPVPEQAIYDDEDEHDDRYPDDADSVMTEKVGAEDLDGDWIGDEMPLKAYDPETDEIHNLHTHWSVIRLRFREPLAELLAVTCQLTLGFCADLVVTLSSTSSNPAGNEATTDWAWGLATMVGIYIAGGISGAHLNPAISIMLWIYRGFPLRKVPTYVLAQILGAFLAALISFGLYQDGIRNYAPGESLENSGTMGAFLCYPRYAYLGGASAFFTEFTATAILAVAVLALGDDTNAPPGAGMNAFVLGLIITVLSMAFGYNTGAAMNPARDLGPRLALLALGYGKQIFTNSYWFWGSWLGPIFGAIFGAFLYDAAIFVGGESPVNYPRRRIKRASKKWRKRWAKRLGRSKRRLTGNTMDDGGKYAGV